MANTCLVFLLDYISKLELFVNPHDKSVMYNLDVYALRSGRFMSKCHFQPVQVNNLLSASAATDYS